MAMCRGAILLSGGAPNKGYALPNAKIMIQQGSGGFEGTPADIEIHAREALDLRRRMAEIMSHHTGQPVEQVERDIDRDRFMTAEEAKGYGIIDEIIASRALAERSSELLPGEPSRLVENASELAAEDGEV